MYNFIGYKKLWLSISVVFVLVSLLFLIIWGLKPGIDFTGGSMLEVKFSGQMVQSEDINKSLASLSLNSLSVQPAENSFILRFQENSEADHQRVVGALQTLALEKNQAKASDLNKYFEELSFTGIGPSVGKELQRKALSSIIIVLLAISLYIAYAFRKVSKPVESWKYGVATLIALFHDVIIVLGFYAILGKFLGVEVNTAFVAAILTVLGFSVHDTIVVFDRLRENLPKSSLDFAGTVNLSLNQTLRRSINTSLTVMIVLLCIVIFGGASIKFFALALLVGIFFGTYSSIFLASPLLVLFARGKNK